MTVNITCRDCDGRRTCEACRNAARTFEAEGHRVEHSTRYAALHAAAAGSYGFDACVVPVGLEERGVIDAALTLLRGKRLALVVDGDGDQPRLAAHGATVISRARFASGDFSTAWLREAPSRNAMPKGDEAAADDAADGARRAELGDSAHATRRLKRVADGLREKIAGTGLRRPPRLDLLAVLEDELAWARASGSSFGIVLVHLPGISTVAGDDAAAIDARLDQAHATIANAVRSSDVVSGRGDDFLVVLPEADARGTALALARIASAIGSSLARGKTKQRRGRSAGGWSIGSALFRDHGSSRESLLAHATASRKPV